MINIKHFRSIMNANKKPHDKWIKDWEQNSEYINHMKVGYKDTDPSRLALGLIKPNSKVLSAGCGCGREVRYLVRNLNCQVTAIDNSENMIKLSQEIEPNALYIKDDITSFDSSESYDYIICLFNTINCLKDLDARRRFCRTSYFNLKPNGKLIIVSKNKYGDMGAFVRSILWRNDFFYNPKQIDNWFIDNQVKINKVKIGNALLIIADKDDK